MPRDMFGSVTDPPVHFGAKSKYSVPIAFLVHLAVLVPLIIIPILASDVLPKPPTIIGFVVEPPPPPPEPPPPVRRPTDPPPQRAANPDVAPTDAPEGIAPESKIDLVPFEDSVPGPGTIVGDTIDRIAPVAPPPPPPQQPVQVGGKIRAPERLHYVSPEYPAVARAARIEGTVIIQATIDADGRVMDARVLRSVSLLDHPAVEAVRQWRYTPTTLNGVAVPVIMTVTVTFKLQ